MEPRNYDLRKFQLRRLRSDVRSLARECTLTKTFSIRRYSKKKGKKEKGREKERVSAENTRLLRVSRCIYPRANSRAGYFPARSRR